MSKIKIATLTIILLAYITLGYNFYDSIYRIENRYYPVMIARESEERDKKEVRDNHYLLLAGLSAVSALTLYAIKDK